MPADARFRTFLHRHLHGCARVRRGERPRNLQDPRYTHLKKDLDAALGEAARVHLQRHLLAISPLPQPSST